MTATTLGSGQVGWRSVLLADTILDSGQPWALSCGAYGACRASGNRIIRPSSRSAPSCCASSKTCSVASTPSRWGGVVQLINPILRGWVNYFAFGNARRCFGFIKDRVEKVQRQPMRPRVEKASAEEVE